MTRLLVELNDDRDVQVLVSLLDRLHIRFRQTDATPRPSEDERAEALRVIEEGCDMSTFGDGLTYQQEVRQERALPYRDH